VGFVFKQPEKRKKSGPPDRRVVGGEKTRGKMFSARLPREKRGKRKVTVGRPGPVLGGGVCREGIPVTRCRQGKRRLDTACG